MTSKISAGANKVTTVVATIGAGPDTLTEISYMDVKVIGNGSFGVVYQAKLVPSNDVIAIKKVLQDRRFKNRELQVMRKLRHPNIIPLRFFFYTSGEKRDEVFLNLVMDFMPETLYKVERQFSRTKQTVPINYVRLYMYQLFRGLAYMHSLGYCHRDIKPQNMLLDTESGVFKLCDFGSAKQLVASETNVSYICSRYYRAPELIFGATQYTTKIDMWSSGCVLAELLLGQLIFPGDSGVDQIVEIVKVMGTPTSEQLHDMNPNYKQLQLPQLKPHPWSKVFRIKTVPEAIDLVSKLLIYTPNDRISPMLACAHPFFDELRQDPQQQMPNGRQLPPLFDFTEHEKEIEPQLLGTLLPNPSSEIAVTSDKAMSRHSAGEDLRRPSATTLIPDTKRSIDKAATTLRLERGNGDNAAELHVSSSEEVEEEVVTEVANQKLQHINDVSSEGSLADMDMDNEDTENSDEDEFDAEEHDIVGEVLYK